MKFSATLNEIEKYLGFEINRIAPPSREDIQRAKAGFKDKITSRPILKEDNSAQLSQNILRQYFNGTRKRNFGLWTL